MAVLIYFTFMGTVVLVGFGILGLTFRQWYIENRDRRTQEKA